MTRTSRTVHLAPPGLLCALLAACAPSATAQTMISRITDAPADARVLERTIDVRIEADGRMTWSERRVVEFLTDFAQELYADPVILYDAARQHLTIATARTVEPDGTVQDTPAIGINELTPGELAAAPAFADLRETVVTHVGIRPAAKTELAFTIEDTAPPPLGIAGGEIALRWAVPIDKLELRVTAADGVSVSFGLPADLPAPEVGRQDATATYVWRNLPAVDLFEASDHVGGPADGLDGPRIVFTTQPAAEAVLAAIRSAADAAAAPDDDVRARAAALAAAAPTPGQRVEAAQALVGEDLATVRLPRSLGFRSPAAAGDVLRRSSGTPLEKAVLLAALLRALDVPATVLVAAPPGQTLDGVLWPGSLDEAGVAAVVGGAERWLPVDRRGVVAPGALFAGRLVYRLDGSVVRPAGPGDAAAANVADADVHVDVRADGSATANVSLTLAGVHDPYAELREKGKDPAQALSDATAAFLPDGEAGDVVLDTFDDERTSGTAAVEGTLAAEAPRTLTLPLPWPGRDLLPENLFRGARDTPLELEAPFRRTIRWTIAVPDGWKARLVPRDVRVDAAAGRFVQQVVVGNGEVRVERTIEVDLSRIEPGAYAGLLEIYRAFVTAGGEPVVLGR